MKRERAFWGIPAHAFLAVMKDFLCLSFPWCSVF